MPHSARILMCLEMAGRLISKFSAMEFRGKGFCAISLMISRRGGSAMAWNTSLLIMCNRSVTNIGKVTEWLHFATDLIFGYLRSSQTTTIYADDCSCFFAGSGCGFGA